MPVAGFGPDGTQPEYKIKHNVPVAWHARQVMCMNVCKHVPSLPPCNSEIGCNVDLKDLANVITQLSCCGVRDITAAAQLQGCCQAEARTFS